MQTILLVVVMFAVIYFFFLRPKKKQEQAANELYNNLRVGDEVTTTDGIIGEIVSIKGETATIETAKSRTRIRILKSAIARVDVRAEDK